MMTMVIMGPKGPGWEGGFFDTNAWYATSVWVYGQVVLSVMSGI